MDVPGYEGLYVVSNLGRVKNLQKRGPSPAGRVLTAGVNEDGYLRVKLCRNAADQKKHRVHRLVLAAFIGQRSHEWEANHKNGCREDNRLENLEYLRHQENCAYSARVLKNIRNDGERNPRAQITAPTAELIRCRVHAGEYRADVARDLGIKTSLVNDVVSGRTWPNL